MSDITPSLVGSDHNEAAFAQLASAVLQQAPIFVGICDAQLRPCFLNAAGREMVGLPADADISAYQISDFFGAEHRSLFEAVGLPTMLREGYWESEICFRHSSDPLREAEVRWSAVALRDGAGGLIGAVILTNGISDRMPAERALRAVGVSRDTGERQAFGERLRRSESRLHAATDLVGIGIYSWDPLTDALDWDERLRAMWGLAPDAVVDTQVFEDGIHPDDLPNVRSAIAACVDPAKDGRYDIEYRVRGRDDGITRYIATSGQTTFVGGRAVWFIGAAIDVTGRHRSEAAIRASEAQFRSFAAHSSNLIWIGDPSAGTIIYRSAAYERIWGVPCREAATTLSEWIKDVHPDDRQQVENALASVASGEVVKFEYRIVRPGGGGVRSLRDTSFPIPNEGGAVARIGGITEDLTQEDVRQVYIVSTRAGETRRLARLVRGLDCQARTFASGSAFLDMAPVLNAGCVLVDLRKFREEGLSILRELKARSVPLPVIALDAPAADVAAAVAAMRAGAIDYLVIDDEASFRAMLANAIAECHGAMRPTQRDENAGARVARLTPREREVLVGLVEGGTNKSIARKLGISPRTVELHRAQVMNRLNADSLTELLQVALAAGIAPSSGMDRPSRFVRR